MDFARVVKGVFILLTLALGIGDLLSLLPEWLDLFGDALAYLMLSMLWYELNIPAILFGTTSKKMNLAILTILYILAVKHVVFTATTFETGRLVLVEVGSTFGLVDPGDVLEYASPTKYFEPMKVIGKILDEERGKVIIKYNLNSKYPRATGVTLVGLFDDQNGTLVLTQTPVVQLEYLDEETGEEVVKSAEFVVSGTVKCANYTFENQFKMIPLAPVTVSLHMREEVDWQVVVGEAHKDVVVGVSSTLDEWSMAIGFLLLAIYSATAAWAVDFTGSSFAYSFFVLVTSKLTVLHSFDVAVFWQLLSADFRSEPTHRLLAFLLVRFIAVYYALLGFFMFVFDTVTQWLVVSIDKSLYVVAFLYALSYFRSLDIAAANKFGAMDEQFVILLASLFTRSRLVYLGLSALLITHVIADAGYFILPSLFGGMETRMVNIDPTIWAQRHRPPIELLTKDIAGLQGPGVAMTVAVYVLDTIALLFLMAMPVAVFVLMASKEMGGNPVWKHWFVTRLLLALFLSSAVAHFMAPWSSMGMLHEGYETYTILGQSWELPTIGNVGGVDFQTQPLGSSADLFPVILGLSTVILLTVLALWSYTSLRNLMLTGSFILSMLFFSQYIFIFSACMILYFSQLIVGNINLALVKMFGDFMIVTVAFYLVSYLMFIFRSGEWFAATALDISEEEVRGFLAIVTVGVVLFMAAVIMRQGNDGILAAVTAFMVHAALAWGLKRRMDMAVTSSAPQPSPTAAQSMQAPVQGPVQQPQQAWNRPPGPS